MSLSKHLVANRISGDIYEITSPHTTLNERGSWNYVCRLAESHSSTRVDVANSYSSESELANIEYRPTRQVPLSLMVRPSMARSAVIVSAE